MADEIVARDYQRARRLGFGIAVVATGIAVVIRRS
jgi:hypothetical protein